MRWRVCVEMALHCSRGFACRRCTETHWVRVAAVLPVSNCATKELGPRRSRL